MRIIKAMIKFLLIIIGIPILITLYARFIEPNLMVSTNVSFKSETAIMPMKVVFFSDTHFGELYSQKNLEKIVSKINKQKADIVVFGGDLLDSYYRDKSILDLEYIGKQLSLIDAKYEKVAVFGNHDYGGGAIRFYEDFMNENGFKVLKNQRLTVKELNLTITGLDDYLLGNPIFFDDYMSNDSFNLLISHAPDIADNIDLDNVDVVISGHSHGGQVSLPFLTDKVLPEGARKYVKGEYTFENKKGTKLFVSKGLGVTKMPYRFLNVPEITVLDIKVSK